jgi:cytochrome c-type biogenesis protein CcmH
MKRFLALALLVLLAAAPGARGVEPDEQLADPALEAQAREISAGLRCLVCQNQSIDDSAAPLARDLRLLVRERLTAGDSPEEVRDYLVARYGDFILLKPPMSARTVLLWLTPAVVLAIGGAIMLRRAWKGRKPAEEPLSPEEEARLGTLLKARD